MARSVIVGDVHGCAAELAELLDRVAFATGDRLVLVGDLVARGPDSRGVLELVRRIGGRSVLGNHEQRLLEARAERASGRLGPRLSPSHERVLAELSAEDWELVESLPCRIDLPPHELSVVHAGIVPGVPLAEQDPWVLTHLRTIDDGGTPSARLGPPLWGTRYTGPPHIAFGHNALSGLQLHDWATGLDTGCVYGKVLSALVLGEGERVPPAADRRDLIVSVPARDAYFS